MLVQIFFSCRVYFIPLLTHISFGPQIIPFCFSVFLIFLTNSGLYGFFWLSEAISTPLCSFEKISMISFKALPALVRSFIFVVIVVIGSMVYIIQRYENHTTFPCF